MSFVIAVPDLVEAAAQDLAGIRSALDEVTEAIVASTTTLIPAAQDEVSTTIAALFGAFGQEYQALNAEVAAFHNAFVNAMTGGAAAYLDAEIANGGTVTHHHAVGRDHRPWYDRQRPPLFAAALKAAKATLDPQALLNPGVLIDP